MARQRSQPAEHLAAMHRTSAEAASWLSADAIFSSTHRSTTIFSKIKAFLACNSCWGVFNGLEMANLSGYHYTLRSLSQQRRRKTTCRKVHFPLVEKT